jgi:hypothetical protein
MITKSIYGLSVAAIFAVTIGMTGLIPSAVADEWKVSNGFASSNFFGTGPSEETPVISTVNAVAKSGTAVDLSLATWNGFEANNYFGTGYSQELSTTNNEFRAFAVQMAEATPNHDSVSKSGTAVDLSLATWNGFEADNFFGTGLN